MVTIVNIVTFENYKKGRKCVDRNAVVLMTANGTIWYTKIFNWSKVTSAIMSSA